MNRVTVFRWIKQGKIRAIRIGKEFRISGDKVKMLLVRRRLTRQLST